MSTQLAHLVEGIVEIVVRRVLVAAVDGDGGLRRAPNTWPSVMKPASTRLSSTTLARARAARQVDVRRVFGRGLEQAGAASPASARFTSRADLLK